MSLQSFCSNWTRFPLHLNTWYLGMPLEFNFIESFVSLLCWISCFLYLISFYFLTSLSEDILLLISQQIYKRDNSFENLGIYKMFILLLFLNYGLDKVGSIFLWIWWDCFNSLNSITIPEHSQTIWFLIMYKVISLPHPSAVKYHNDIPSRGFFSFLHPSTSWNIILEIYVFHFQFFSQIILLMASMLPFSLSLSVFHLFQLPLSRC